MKLNSSKKILISALLLIVIIYLYELNRISGYLIYEEPGHYIGERLITKVFDVYDGEMTLNFNGNELYVETFSKSSAYELKMNFTYDRKSDIYRNGIGSLRIEKFLGIITEIKFSKYSSSPTFGAANYLSGPSKGFESLTYHKYSKEVKRLVAFWSQDENPYVVGDFRK